MIFVTVGAQMPFDRMVQAIDRWAADRSRDDVFAQIGPTEWHPSAIEWTKFLQPPEFASKVEEADAIVAHAGMGSIITALTTGKPILVMPRRGDLRETRNDHQIATARRFAELGRVAVAFDESELEAKLDVIGDLRAADRVGPDASEQLIGTIREFIEGKDSGE